MAISPLFLRWLMVLGCLLGFQVELLATEGPLIPTGEPFSREQAAGLVQVQLSRVSVLVFDNQGETLATGEESGRVCLWDVQRQFPLRCVRPKAPGRVTALRFSPRGDWLAVGFADGRVQLHQRDGKTDSCELPTLDEKIAVGRSILALHFASEHSLLAVGSKRGALRKWERVLSEDRDRCSAAPQGAPFPVEDFPSPLIEGAAIDREGRFLAVSFGVMMGVWELGGGRKRWLSERLPPGGFATAVGLSPDGRALVVGMLDGSVQGFDAQSGRRFLSRGGPPHSRSKILTVEFSPDGQHFAVAVEDRSLSVWTVSPFAPVWSKRLPSSVTALVFSPSGTQLAVATADDGIAILNPLRPKAPQAATLRGNVSAVRALAIDPSGQRLVTVSDNREVRVWSRGSREGADSRWQVLCRSETQPEYLSAVAFVGTESQLVAIAGDGRSIRLLNPDTCSPVRELESPSRDTTVLAASRSGRFLVAGSEDGTIHVYDVSKSEWKKEPLRGHRDSVISAVFSPIDESLLATGSYDKTVRVWNVATGELVHALPAQGAGVRRLAFSTDGNSLATASGKEACAWRLADYTESARLPHGSIVTGLSLLPDNALTTSDQGGIVRVWDLGTKSERSRWAPAGPEAGVEFSAMSVDAAHGSLFVVNQGRMFERQLQDPTHAVAELWQGPDGWATLTEGTLHRHEVGHLLWRREERDRIASVPPPLTFPNLKFAKLEVSARSSSDDPGAQGEATIHVSLRNLSDDKVAYWLRWRVTLADGNAALPLGVEVSLPKPEMRLDPGQELSDVKIPITLHYNPLLSPIPPPSTLSLVVAVEVSGGSSVQNTVEVQMGPWWWPAFRLYKQLGQLASLQKNTILLLTALLAAIGVLWQRQRRFSAPLVQAVLGGLSPIEGKALRELPLIHSLLSTGAFREEWLVTRALQNAGLDRRRWNRLVTGLRSAQDLAVLFAESQLSRLCVSPLYVRSDLAIFRMELPSLSIHVPDVCTLLVCLADDRPVHREMLSLDPLLIPREGLLIIADATGEQAPLADIHDALRHLPGHALRVVLSDEQLKQILLTQSSQTARALFCRALVTQCPVERLSPFRSSGTGIEDAYHRSFLGRERELAQLVSGVKHNFLLVGPRRMGKSSLLKALRRELALRMPDADVTSFCFGSVGSLSGLFHGEPSLPSDTPEAFHRSVLSRSPKHQVYLLDEVDYFLDVEKQSDYPYCSVMRALSAQGRASFVLCGHREVQQALRTADHPLRNFGDKLLLGPLDQAAASNMLLAPLADFGIQLVDSQATIAWICQQTACRPHLLSFVGDTLLRLREPFGARPISLTEVQESVLSASAIKDDLGNWDASTGALLLDGLVLRTVLLQGRTTLGAIQSFLQNKGVSLRSDQIRLSIHRVFDMQYGLLLEPNGEVYCPLPLLEHHLSNPQDAPHGRPWTSPAARLLDELARDVRSFNEQAPSAAAVS